MRIPVAHQVGACPFCASTSLFILTLSGHEVAMVVCDTCLATGPEVHLGSGFEQRAVEKWNNRKENSHETV